MPTPLHALLFVLPPAPTSFPAPADRPCPHLRAQTKLVVKPDCLFGKRGKHDLVGLNLDFAQAEQFIKARMNKVGAAATAGWLTHVYAWDVCVCGCVGGGAQEGWDWVGRGCSDHRGMHEHGGARVAGLAWREGGGTWRRASRLWCTVDACRATCCGNMQQRPAVTQQAPPHSLAGTVLRCTLPKYHFFISHRPGGGHGWRGGQDRLLHH